MPHSVLLCILIYFGKTVIVPCSKYSEDSQCQIYRMFKESLCFENYLTKLDCKDYI